MRLTRKVQNEDNLLMSDSHTNWHEGWLNGLKYVRDYLNDIREKTNSPEAQKAIDDTFARVKELEKSAFHFAPTLVSSKDPKK